MSNRTVRRSVAVITLAASLLAVAGCDMVKAGAKCKATSGPGRDATHVLFCQKGKWTRVMTIGQAADFIMSTWPTTVEVVEGGGGQTTGVGEAFSPVAVRVTRKDGQPVKGADVVFKGPDSGASLAAPSGLIPTDADGIARFTPVANGIIGGYGVSATVNGGTSPYVYFGLNNGAAAASSIVVVSGGGQSAVASTQFAPVSVKAVDRFGNLVQYKNFEFSSTAAGVWFGPAEAFAGEDGIATTTIGTGNVAGTVPITVKVAGSTTATTFNLTVTPGAAIAANYVKAGGEGESAQASARFLNPMVVAFSDTFGNGVAGQSPTWAVVDGGAGTASGTLEVFPSDANGLARVWITGNGIPGTFQVTATAFSITYTFNVTLTA